jgi:hypothetical protein
MGSPSRPGRSIRLGSRACVTGGPSAEEVDDVGQGVLVADVAGEHDVGRADDLGEGLDGPEHRHQAGQELAEDRRAADAQAADGDVVGGDAALGDDPGRARPATAPRDDLDDRGGHLREISRLAAGSVSRTQGAAGEQEHVGTGERAPPGR